MCLAVPGKIVEIIKRAGFEWEGGLRRDFSAKLVWIIFPKPRSMIIV